MDEQEAEWQRIQRELFRQHLSATTSPFAADNAGSNPVL
jgi:hypothetical protein